jgi:hypothetical protein
MSEHTPGPWKADANSGWFPWPEAIGIFSDCETVAWTTSMASARERDEANARLIAAAPDMLRELIGILEWAKVEKAPLRAQEIKSITALIAKATNG